MERKNSTPVNLEVSNPKKEPLIDASAKADLTKTADILAHQDKSSKLQKKSAKSVRFTSLNKKDFVLKFVKQSSSLVWPREMKIVNSLFKLFPNEQFWNSLELKFKLNSLCWFLSDDGRKYLNIEYKKFQFEPAKPEVFEIKKNNIAFEGKIGETVEAPMTVREFLNLWQKKN
jgi:hypothetical protein